MLRPQEVKKIAIIRCAGERSCDFESAWAVSSGRRRVVPRIVRIADTAATARVAHDCSWGLDAHPRADRQRQDAHRLPLVPRPADVLAPSGKGPALPRLVR